MSPLRIIEYVLLLILAIGSAYVLGFSCYTLGWGIASVAIPLVVIVLLVIGDRRR
ncbi:MAG TPA: hypothetical protein VEG65_01540 [Candidatus Bathyarchaeia archaeon]|nr:hypothetical protein [Candidatus Bathyarchaeia archaeon]